MAPGEPPVTRREYLGCGLWVLGFGVLVIISFTVGALLRPDPEAAPGEDAVTLLEQPGGESAGYTLVGFRDELDEPCVSLRRPGVEGEVTGQCGFAVGEDGDGGETRYAVTSSELPDGTTVVFAPVPREADQVRLELDDGTTPTAEVRISETAQFSWFVYEADTRVAGPATLLDANGEPVSP